MDAVTAISGSGPAYFFYLTESLTKAANRLGLSGQLAHRLVINTALGSALLLVQTKKSAKGLKKLVASKGGTTEAALRILKRYNWDQILQKAVRAAAQRSKELKR